LESWFEFVFNGLRNVFQLLLQLEPINAHNFIKIIIILQQTSSYMFQALSAHHQEHSIVQHCCLTFSACNRTTENSSMCNICVAD